MDENIYQAPQAELTIDNNIETRFYVVSPKKFLSLFICTLGVYGIYWFYRNWSLQKDAGYENIWPGMRGVFSIFFTHSLFRDINSYIEKQDINYTWKHNFLANIYVISAIFSNVSDRLSAASIGSPFTDIFGLVLMGTMIWSIYKAQIAINIACNDPQGLSNSHFSMANIVWIVLGIALWGLIFGSLFVDA